MKKVVPFKKAVETSLYGSKAVGLGDAARQGLQIPPGVSLSGDLVEAVASGDDKAIEKVAKAIAALPPPFAVRSSAVDEDGAAASFAGQHLTVLNVHSAADVPGAVREVWWSANSDSAITYRQRVGRFTRPSVGVVVQTLLNPTAAGVMFTENPVTGADERLIEASWGLGEAVVNGLVVPDHFRLTARPSAGRKVGRKRIAIRCSERGPFEEQVPPAQVNQLCLDDASLRPWASSPAVQKGSPAARYRMGVSRWDALPSSAAPLPPGRHAARHHRPARLRATPWPPSGASSSSPYGPEEPSKSLPT
jgi:pyruvate,water dikinase